jgi:hypothetical protein
MGQVKVRYGMFPQGLYNAYYIGTDMPDSYNDKDFLARAWTRLKLVLWPKRCHVSGKWMWLTRAYCADFVICGPGEPAVWTRWYSESEFLILKLKYPHENDYA